VSQVCWRLVLDYVLQSRQLPHWMNVVVGWIGEGTLAIRSCVLVAVAAIAVAANITFVVVEKYQRDESGIERNTTGTGRRLAFCALVFL
jgi:hypothetical protein